MTTPETHPAQPATPPAFVAPAIAKIAAGALLVPGLALFGLSFAFGKEVAWAGWLMGSWYVLGFALFASFFLTINALASGGWAAVIKRVPEAMTRYFAFGIVPFGVVAFAMWGGHLYEWAVPHEGGGLHAELIHHKEPWLNKTGWLLRTLLYFGLWTGFTWLMVRHSRAQDVDGDLKHTWAVRKLAAPFGIVFGLSVTFASIDYIKSLEPTWFSTMFGVYQFAGIIQSGFAMLVLLLVLLRAGGHMREHVNENHYHNLGIWLLSSSVFWAYIWFCQFMLIWYSNIPEETQHYFVRWNGPWFWVSFILNPLLNFAIPFLVLLPRPHKRNLKILSGAALVVLAGRFVDLWQWVAPRPVFNDHHLPVPSTTPWETIFTVGPVLALSGVFLFIVMKAMEGAPLFARKDPFFDESVHHHL
ncbi:MAG: hypothetical protein HS108_08935 [Planctomycetes bacterium]|jgi:hypothetical protein|nr:hypothetical protein [Planctomycetota bacterium]MCL4730751.1 hypothetical protein [Planctomycetota bacterium]